jgi:hypothetical protein
MLYDPTIAEHRRILAVNLLAMLTTAGFTKINSVGEEVWVFAYRKNPKVILKCYTSIEGGYIRPLAEDAIKFVMLFQRDDGSVVVLDKERRVNRTGEIDDIVERALLRLRGMYSGFTDSLKAGHVCKRCNAPLFLSKKGVPTCAAVCWAPKKNGVDSVARVA